MHSSARMAKINPQHPCLNVLQIEIDAMNNMEDLGIKKFVPEKKELYEAYS